MGLFRRKGEDRAPALVEQRSPSAATTQVRYQTPGQPMLPTWDAETAIQNAYLADVVVARCTQIRAQTVASVPFRAGADPERPMDFNPKARLAQLLGPGVPGPAPKLSSQTLWEWTEAQRVVTGRYGWEVETTPGGNEITALWPLTSSWLRAIPSQGGSSWFSRFEYGRLEAPRKLREDQVVYGWDPNLSDFRQPYSVLQSARLEVSVAVMCARYNYGFLRNDARPAAIMVVEQFADRDEFRRFKQLWSGEFGGVDNAGKLAILEANPDGGAPAHEAVSIQQLGLSQKDARLIEQHKAALEHIAIAMGVPWSKLDASGRTFDNAEVEDRTWWEERVLPMLRHYADEINIQLAPRLGNDVGWFDLSKVRALKPKRKFVSMADAVAAFDAGLVTKNEVRADIDLEPLDDGDEIAEPVPALPAPPPMAALPPAPVAVAVPTTAAAPAPEIRTPLARRVIPTTTTTTANVPFETNTIVYNIEPSGCVEGPSSFVAMTETRAPDRATVWRHADATVRTLERRWERAMRRLFGRQERAVLARLEGNRGRQWLAHAQGDETRAMGPDEVFERQFWVDETVATVEDLYEAVMAGSLLRMSNQFGIAFDLADPWAQEFIAARSNQLAGQVTATTYEDIQEALLEGVEAGESIPDLATRVRDVFSVASETRATTIARTETISAFNGSAVLGAAQLGPDIVSEQEWLATSDTRTRDDHSDVDGQPVPIGQPFIVGGEELMYPGDPNGSPGNIINCRCTVIFTAAEEPERSARSERRVAQMVAAAVIDMVPRGRLDELAIRRALRQEAA